MAKLHRAAEPDVLKPLIERGRLTPESVAYDPFKDFAPIRAF